MAARILLTLKQHRFETISVTILCLGLAVLAVFEAWRLFALNTPAACLANGYGIITAVPVGPTSSVPAVDPCQIPIERRNAVLGSFDMNLVRTLLVFAPFVSGIAFGAPLVAREIEQGTAPLSWALAGSRWRWLLARIFAMTLLIVPVLLAIGLASDYLESALIPNTDPHSSFDTYLLRGVILVFWGLAAFLGTVALGTIFGRTLPALFLALVICGFVRVAWEYEMNRVVLAPAEQALLDPTKASDPFAGDTRNPWQTDLVFDYRTYLDGKPISEAELTAWYMANQPKLDANGNPIGGFVPPDPSQSPYQVPFGIPGSQYWPVVALESGILLAGSIFCGGLALVWVERRRPY